MITSIKGKVSNKKERAADRVIEKIRENILSGDIKPGARIANEKELMEQFGISKATIREALRVLEAMGLLEIRKGVGGGAFVAEVDMRTTIHSVINFCHFQPLSIRDITMLRYFIEPKAAMLAARERTEEDIQNLRRIIQQTYKSEVEKEIGFHCYLGRITKNPLLILIIDFIDNILKTLKSRLNLDKKFFLLVENHHKFILECVLQKDPQAARIMMTNDILEVGRFLACLTNSEAFDPYDTTQMMASEDNMLALGYLQKVVSNTDAINRKTGVIIRRVGTSNLNLISYKPGKEMSLEDEGLQPDNEKSLA